MSIRSENKGPVVAARDLVVTYGHGRSSVRALRGVSLEVFAGETVGVVGESGSGKTTLSRALLGLVKPTGGVVEFRGDAITGSRKARKRDGRMQVVLQNPDWSLNPSLRVGRSVAEPMVITRSVPRERRQDAVDDILTRVGLDTAIAARYPHELSGGQRQRVAIARAIVTQPDLVIFDEAVTALDASVQTQVLNLIRALQAERGFAAVFVSHDLAAVRYVSHRIAVAQSGQLVEVAAVDDFYGTPAHPYSRRLRATLPDHDPGVPPYTPSGAAP